MLNWLPRSLRFARGFSVLGAPRAALRLEPLEAREVPAILIQLDYTYDTGFFANNPQARAVLQQVAAQMGESISANLSAITPSGGNTWGASFYNPQNGALTTVSNLSVAADAITIFVGARPIAYSEAAFGGFGGYSISGSQPWINTVETRGWSGFAPWGGSITFDSSQNWDFGLSASGLTSGQTDFYSVAEHELGHVLGIGTASQWKALSANGTFTGANSVAVYGGAVPVTPDDAHWANGVTVGGQQAVMDPTLPMGARVQWTALDAAALRDIGWGPASPPAPAPAPIPAPIPAPTPPVFTPVPVAQLQSVVFSGGSDGTLTMFQMVNGVLSPTGQQFTPFVGYHGVLRVAAGDFYGNGETDYAITTGSVGPQAVVEIVSGIDGSLLVNQTAVFPGFDGGLFLAAGAIDGNGKDQLAVAAGPGAGPAVQTFEVVGNTLVLESSFFAFGNPAYGGGVRLAIGDINHDGFADLVTVTGGGTTASVAIYSGAQLRFGSAALLTTPFSPFPGYLGGLNGAVGNLDGSGFDDIAIIPDNGGSSHLEVFSGTLLSTGANPTSLPLVANFFVFSPADPSGARLAMRDLEGNGLDDIIVTSENPLNSAARVFNYADFQTGNLSAPIQYPIGTATLAGLYAADHTAPADTANTTNSTNTNTNPSNQPDPVPARIDTANTAHTFTATFAAATSGCTCPACLALARALKAAESKDGQTSTMTVM
jgi:hypothetical protein